jgi:hypothetical protein
MVDYLLPNPLTPRVPGSGAISVSWPGRLTRPRDATTTALACECQASQQPPAELAEFLDEGAKLPDWSAIVAVLRRILAGERDETALPLLTGLDPVDTAIARETLRRLEQAA